MEPSVEKHADSLQEVRASLEVTNAEIKAITKYIKGLDRRVKERGESYERLYRLFFRFGFALGMVAMLVFLYFLSLWNS